MIVPKTASQRLYEAAGHNLANPHAGLCYFCGGAAYEPTLIKHVIKPTFNDFNAARGDMSAGVCVACVWTLVERSEEMQVKTGKDKLQAFRTYSHFVHGGSWHVYSKGQKANMLALLRTGVMPEVCVVSESGQKHLAFKARLNPDGQPAGWAMLEESIFWLDLNTFNPLQQRIEAMYLSGYSKDSIGSGNYTFYPNSDIALYRLHEPVFKLHRGSATFALALYLTTKPQEPVETEEPQNE